MNETTTIYDFIALIEKAMPDGFKGLSDLQNETKFDRNTFWFIVKALLHWYVERGKPYMNHVAVHDSVKWYLSLIAQIDLLFQNPGTGGEQLS